MGAKRFFYITQDSLVVWHRRRGRFSELKRFPHCDAGFHDFSAYLRQDPHSLSAIVVDVIEEEFSVDSIPKLPLRDRNALIERRLARKYSRTPYRLGHHQGASHKREGMHNVLYSAVSNHELLEPWLAVVTAQTTPLAGIFSVPLLGQKMLAAVRKPAANAMLLTQHQGNRLRQVYLRKGKLKSARLSQAPAPTDPRYGEQIFNEILRSRRYLERARLIDGSAEIDAYMITDAATAERIIASDEGKLPLHFHFIRTEEAAKVLGLRDVPGPDRLEVLYLELASRRRPGHNYALQGETRYHTLSRIRHAAVGGIVAASLAGSAFAGVNFMNGFELRRAASLMDLQILRMEETFRRENNEFAPLKADSHEMKQAVDTGDYILANRVPVSWVMEQLDDVLTEYPQIRLDELEWRAVSGVDGEPAAAASQRRGADVAENIEPLRAVHAELAAQLVPFDGNLRNAFELIRQFEESLRTNTAFDQVKVTEYPLDANPQSSVSGEFLTSEERAEANFRISLTLNVVPEGDDHGAI